MFHACASGNCGNPGLHVTVLELDGQLAPALLCTPCHEYVNLRHEPVPRPRRRSLWRWAR